MTDIKDIKDIQKSKKDGRILSFILTKSERLSSALYLVTGLIKDTEPIRLELRKKAIQILSDIHASEEKRFLDRAELLGRVIKEIEATRALLQVAHAGGVMSEMNATVISREFGVLKAALETWGDLKDPNLGYSVSPEFFLGAVPFPASTPAAPQNIPIKKEPFPGPASVPAPAPTERREAILGYLREHPGATLREVREGANLGQNISEKTVQRELVSLLAEGAITRAGERRWSRYSASPL